jgi:CubicO group peptidase (beta-lactamase class C family)
MKKICLFLVASLFTLTFTQAQKVNRNKFITDSLDIYINKAMTNWRIPGAAVCIVKDSRIVLMRGYGVKELGLPGKVDINTLFMIGSNTKAFTATALAMLQEQHKLSLNDKVTKYLPDFKLFDKASTEQLTIRDLLCHRLGFETFEGDFTFYNTDLTRQQVMQKLAVMKPVYPFRTHWGYTNSAFLTAGEIIPKVTGQTWESFVKNTIFAPLGMTNTVALSKDFPTAINKTAAHTIVDSRLTAIPYCQIDALAPAGAIGSSVNDMSKWVLALLNNGMVGNRQVISAAAVQETREPQDIVGSVSHLSGYTDYELYGLGWFVQDYNNHRVVMHDGGVNGFVSSVTLVPEEKLGIIILTNTDQNRLYDALRWEIMDAYFKMPYVDYSGKMLARYKAHREEEMLTDRRQRDSVLLNPKPALSLSDYTGKYHNDLYGNMTVTRGENNDLEMHFEHHTKMFAKLLPLGGNRFYVTFTDPEYGKAVFPFTVQKGKVTGVQVKVADFIEKTPYDFRKL